MFENFKKNLSIHKYKTNYEKYDVGGILKSSQRTIEKLSNFFKKNSLDAIIIVGDRYEAFIASYVALILNIKIFHLGGGETTLGSLDDKFRYSISLFSNLHFVTRLQYKYKLINYGIKKNNIYYVGDTSQEFLLKQKKYSKIKVEKKFNIKLNKLNILLCYHPVTNEPNISLIEFTNIIQCLKKLDSLKYNIFITSPNHDQGSDKLIEKIKKTIKLNNFFFIKTFGKYYYSILKNCIFIIGNSSSGITDAHLLKVQAINVGNRQKGRIAPKSVINVQSNIPSIMKGFKKAFLNNKTKPKFLFQLKKDSSKLILKKIEKFLKNEKK